LKRLDPWSVAKVYAVLGLIAGLISGVFIAAASAMVLPAGTTTAAGMSLWIGLGVMMVIIGPILGAIAGLLGGIIGAVLYNIVAKWVGGIEMKFE